MIDEMKRLKRELMYKGAILDIYKDTMQFANGTTEEWDFVSHRKGAAAVLPVLPDGRVILVRQYRNALERETLELPAGCRDSLDEDTKLTAARELEEETGYRAGSVEWLITVRTTVAFCNEKIDIYLGRDVVSGKQHLDEDEYINVEAYTVDELCEKIFSGEIEDSKTIAAVMAYKAKYC